MSKYDGTKETSVPNMSYSELCTAVRNKDFEAVKSLYQPKNTNISLSEIEIANINLENDMRKTKLYSAIENEDIDRVILLLSANADVNMRSGVFSLITPLHLAIEKGNVYLVALLLSKGANVDAEVFGLTPFYHAIDLNNNLCERSDKLDIIHYHKSKNVSCIRDLSLDDIDMDPYNMMRLRNMKRNKLGSSTIRKAYSSIEQVVDDMRKNTSARSSNIEIIHLFCDAGFNVNRDNLRKKGIDDILDHQVHRWLVNHDSLPSTKTKNKQNTQNIFKTF
jgi:ankyrin repeat protein